MIEKRKVKDTKSETDILEFPDRVAVSKFMKLEVGGLQTERGKSGKGGMMVGMGSLNSETKSVFKYGTSGRIECSSKGPESAVANLVVKEEQTSEESESVST